MLFTLPKILFLNSHDQCPLFSQNQPIILNEKRIHSTGKQSSTLWIFLFLLELDCVGTDKWSNMLIARQHDDHCHQRSQALTTLVMSMRSFTFPPQSPRSRQPMNKPGNTQQRGVSILMRNLIFSSTLRGLLFPKKFPINVHVCRCLIMKFTKIFSHKNLELYGKRKHQLNGHGNVYSRVVAPSISKLVPMCLKIQGSFTNLNCNS